MRLCHLLWKTTLNSLHPIIPSHAEQGNCKPKSSFQNPKTSWSDSTKHTKSIQIRQLRSRNSTELSSIPPIFPYFSSRITAPHGGKTRFFSRCTAPAALTMCTSPPRRSATAFSPQKRGTELLGQGSATAGRWVSWVKALSSDGKPWENHGKPMENPWKNHGKPMENLRIWQDFVDFEWFL